MTKTVYFVAIATVFIATLLAVSPIAIATVGGEDESLLFSWDPADASSDPNNLVVISGSFSRQGLLTDTTTDVEGEFEGLLKGDSENNSEKTVVSAPGSITITTTVKAKSQDANDLEGAFQIDGDAFETKLTLVKSKVTKLEVSEEFSGPSVSQSLEQEKLTIPVTIEMCDESDKCFEGFGVIRRESSTTSAGGATITFATDELEAEVIGEDGLFELKLSLLQRTIT